MVQTAEQQMEWVRQGVSEHGAALERYAFSLCGRTDLAADAVQETFVRLLRAEKAQVESYLLPWLLRVCRTRVLDLLRSEGRMKAADTLPDIADPAAPDPAQTAADRDRLRAVLDRVGQLPPNQCEVIRLKFINDLSYKEIAEVTGLSVSNVGFLLHTALARLRQQLNPKGAMGRERKQTAAPREVPRGAQPE